MLSKRGIKHNVLNAKQHAKEAEIVAQAGQLGAVTIATNMAGRGTDILLGGNAEFLAKADMKRAGMEEELISEAISYADTDDEAILAAREEYKKLYAKHQAVIKDQADKVRAAGCAIRSGARGCGRKALPALDPQWPAPAENPAPDAPDMSGRG